MINKDHKDQKDQTKGSKPKDQRILWSKGLKGSKDHKDQKDQTKGSNQRIKKDQ